MGPERKIEDKARKYMESRGGQMIKLVSPGNAGVPDRLCLHANCGVFFIEFKAPGKTSTPLQRLVQERMALNGARVYRDVDSTGMAMKIIDDEINGVEKRFAPV